MSYSLYLDDEREPKGAFDYVARSNSEAKLIVRTIGVPAFISFDHDLGNDDDGTGYDFAKWLINLVLDEGKGFPIYFKYNVHSANPVGRENIEKLFENYFKVFKF
jgi:hypothetical protein